ncbi:MAG: hypothetical protein ACI8P3_003670 [Saprospiraceae bacterium]|jgi:hypothetical protein
MLKYVFGFIFGLLFLSQLNAQQETGKYKEIGLEYQQYPTGALPGLRVELSWAAHHSVALRVGYNIARHGNAGEHQLEEGGGFGGTLGYRYYLKPENIGLFFGGRTDLWFNKIDWKDEIGTANELVGQTDIIVLQPTAVIGYLFFIQKKITIAPNLAVGYEINIAQRGANVGEGAIVLGGLTVGVRF